jgi:inner membrane protein
LQRAVFWWGRRFRLPAAMELSRFCKYRETVYPAKDTSVMDQLTHTATGLFLSRAGLEQLTPYAGPILMLAANVPDIDAVAGFGGALSYLDYHRHITHSLAMLPMMALLPVLIVRLFARQRLRWAGAYLISAIGVGSHLALDSTNAYGVRLLLPFSARWFNLDITSVIDVWIWAAILVALAAPLLSRLVSSEIGARTRGPAARRFAIAALAFVLLYNCGRAVLHTRALAVLDARVYQGAAPLRVAAFPNPINPWRFTGLAETRDFFSLHDLDLRAGFDPAAGRIFYKPEASPAIDSAARTPTFRDFLRFAQYPFWRVQPAAELEGGFTVEAMDLRFGSPQAPGFVARAVLTSRLEVVRTWFTFGAAKPR